MGASRPDERARATGGAVALGGPGAWQGGLAVWSDGLRELGERCCEPEVGLGVDAEFVVAAADVLDEGVPGADHLGGVNDSGCGRGQPELSGEIGARADPGSGLTDDEKSTCCSLAMAVPFGPTKAASCGPTPGGGGAI